MVLRLKRRNELKPSDLPYIESAFFAVNKLNGARHDRFNRIHNLDDMLHEGYGLTASDSRQDEHQWKRLLSRVEHSELLLVGDDFNPPFSPVFRKQVRAEGVQGDIFEIHPHHGTNPGGLHGLLRYVGVTALTGAAVAAGGEASAAATAATALAAARPVVPEIKRYPLIAALAYQYPGAEKNKIATLRCKLENEFAGPETRRSSEIKTDPVYRELNRREMSEGDYTLAFQKLPRAVRCLEPKK